MPDIDPKIEALLNTARWGDERRALRDILLGCGLDETVKWGKLTYTLNDSNLAIFYGMKNYCGIGFFKGTLLTDPDQQLIALGKNSQAMRVMPFVSMDEIVTKTPALLALLDNAIEVEKSGQKVTFTEKDDLEFPDELVDALDGNPDLATAFAALTPGRQRGYTLHFAGAKQSTTRVARIEKHTPRILDGKGMNDR